MDNDVIARFLIITGLALAGIGLLVLVAQRLGFSQLPGDFHFQRDGVFFSFPIVSCLLVSVLLTILLNVFMRR